MTTLFTTRPAPASSKLVLATAFLGIFLLNLDSMAMNVALPAVGREFGGSTSALQWIVDAYTLMLAALLLSAGALSDRFGASRAFGAGAAVFTFASAVCGLAPGLGELIGARLLKGGAAAIMLPSSLALVRQAFPDAVQRARAIALWTVGGALAIAAGPVVGGVLAGTLGWRAIFFVNVPVGIVTLVVLARTPSSPRVARPVDLLGQVTAMVALVALTFGVIERSPVALGLAVVAAVAFVVVELRVAAPMVPLGLFRSRAVSVSMVIGFVVNAAFYGLVFVLSLFFHDRLGLSPMAAGLLFLPMTAVIAVANLVSARLAARYGPRVPIVVGQVVCGLAMVSLLWAQTGAVIAVLLVPVGFGLGLVVPSLTAVVMGEVAADRAGMTAGVLNSVRQTGGALAVAVFGAVGGLRVALVVAVVMLVVATAVSLLLPRRFTAD
ncbi:MFS transporter [Lentzea aerocolonigenes]|uniref:MFS transporter n=1 Tax=Lentzea aerocolonigenes TaxID=68170 RepID=A0A0F0GJV4_LENAE|nr:MFS transporter [Lentzea aerocolonigenes]KJK43814.1 MFS transporter [Lentzea aerocolonigenes]